MLTNQTFKEETECEDEEAAEVAEVAVYREEDKEEGEGGSKLPKTLRITSFPIGCPIIDQRRLKHARCGLGKIPPEGDSKVGIE